MSAEETDKTTDDEDWLYGDEGEEGAEQRAADCGPAQPDEDKHQQNGGAEKETAEEDGASDSDDDDDVCVTIGDIKTGGSSQYSAFGATPVNLNIKTDGRTHAAAGIKPKGVDMDALGSINGLPVLDVDVESFEEKPWRKPGADISDYFNYGFNEDTWKVYCDKQRRLRASYEGFSLSTKIMVQQGRMAHGDKDGRSESSCSLFRSASRKSSGTIDVIGGQAGCISRVEGRRRHNMEGNNIQVLSEPSADAEVTSTKMSPFFPPNIPPPPFLPPPNISSTPPLIPPQRIPISVPPPGFPLLPGVPPPPLIPTVDSSHCGGYDPPPAPPFPFPPGVYPPIPGWPGVIDSAKAWEYYARQDRERGRDKERERPRERGYEKERDRGRDRERDHSPSSQLNHSEEERLRHRDHGDRGYRERSSREREERHRERRHRDKDEGRHKSSRSSSSSNRRHDSEEGDSHRRHKHKKTKRSREDKGTNEEPSADQENQSEPTE